MSIIDSKGWQQVSEHLDRVLELPEEERNAYVEELTRSDPHTGSSLARLLSAHRAQAYARFLSGSGPVRGEPAPSPQLVGQRIGPYVIEAEIGRGGMGSVWRARRADGRFEGLVAVKFLRAAWLGSAGEQRFKQEGLLLAKLNHPHIARLLDAGLFDGHQPYLVLEHVEGEPIDTYCAGHELDLHSRLRLFLDVLAAVSHAHTHLIVHRDIKPGNILVTRDGTVKLLDFGIAKLLEGEDGSDLTMGSAHPLTPQYAAPEQLLGEPVTTATDVYALGLVLYAVLTGEHPRAPGSLGEHELVHDVRQELPRLSAAARSPADARALAGDLDNIVAKALKKEAAERYATASALAGDLERYLRHEPVSARPDTLPYRVTKFVRRNRGSVMTGLAIALGLIGTTSFALLQMSEARHQRDAARAELLLAEAANDFSSLMLEEVNVGGKALTPEQLLDRGVELLDARHGAEPEFVAEMLTQLAGRYDDVGREDKAMALTQRALAIARTTHNAPLLALTLCSAAHKEREASIQSDIDRWLAEATAIVQTLPEPPLYISTECLRARAWRASDHGDPKGAIALLEQAHALQVAAGLRTGLGYTSVLVDLGYAYYNQGRYADAYEKTTEVGAAFDRGGRGGTLGRVIIHENAATLLTKMGEIRAAYAELYAAQHPVAGGPAREPERASWAVFSEVLRRLGRVEEARAVVGGRAESLLASGAPVFAARTLMEEAAALIELKQPEQARPLLERGIAIEAQYETGGGSMRFMAESNAYLADIDVQTAHPDAARERLEKFLASYGYPQTPAQVPLQPALLSAARAALALGDFRAAEIYARDALHIAESVARGPDTSADVGESLLVLARIERAEHHLTEVRALLARSLRCLAEGVGPEAPATMQVRGELAHS